MDNFKDVYREEAEELLADIESALLELSEKPDNQELIGCIFRAIHTIKGSGAMFGFNDIVAFTHDVETVLDLVREGIIPVTKTLIDLTLAACDQIMNMIDPEQGTSEGVKTISASLIKLIPEEYLFERYNNESEEEEIPKTPKINNYRIRFRPNPDIFANGTHPLLLMNELKELGECKIIGHTHGIPDLKTIEPDKCYIHWNIILTTSQNLDAVKDIFIFAEENSKLMIESINGFNLIEEDENYKRVGDILLERGDITHEELEKVLKAQKKIGEMLVEYKKVDPDVIESVLVEQQHMRSLGKKRQESAMTSSIRVSSDKLDLLVDLVGELVTVQASLSQRALSLDDPEMLSISEDVERLTSELRDNTISIRMIPFGTIFGKFKRLVYDLSEELGKDVTLTTEGGETELDKNVIERLNDPMIHIIRNCIAHGIEVPEIRKSHDKSLKGNIHLCAEHAGANVLIKISDDGAGLDSEIIRAIAVKNGLISKDADLSENELFSLVFLPGFSTASEVDEICGRGVGMDVVKQAIENLRGSIEISSQKRQGTSIILKLPLTLAIIDGLMVEVGETCYVIPLASVEECMELTREAVKNAHGRNIANVRGEIIPYIYLREFFKLKEKSSNVEQIIIVRLNNIRIGFVVENIIGEHQTVIKSLGKMYKKAKVFSGSTILADGTVALIIDPYKLVEIAESEELLMRN